MRPLTEYRRKYKEKGPACHEDYVVRYEYMVGRRSTEMSHTPLDWESDSDSDSDASTSKSQVGQVKGKHAKKLARLRQRDEQREKNDEPPGPKPERKQHTQQAVNVGIQVDKTEVNDGICKEDEAEKKILKSCLKEVKHSDAGKESLNENKEADKKCRKQHRRRHKKSHRHVETTETKAPLIPYGWAYRGPIDNHKTFNVKVPEREASESALRAQKRREFDILKREEERKRQSLNKKRTEALFNFMEDNDDGWISEYKRNFSGYQSR